jgi:hypothetical protein
VDSWPPTEKMHTMLGADEGSQRDHMRTYLLLDVHWGLGEGEAGMSTVSAERTGAAYPFLEVLNALWLLLELSCYLH